MIREAEEKMEEKVYQIWSVLSSFEESSAACISDMLLHVSNGAYIEGVFVAEKFIWHVEVLFGSADGLDARLSKVAPKGRPHWLEAPNHAHREQGSRTHAKQSSFARKLWLSSVCFRSTRKQESAK